MAINVIFDSNVWVGYLATDDALHTRASRLIDSLEHETLICITNEIIGEVYTVLALRYGQTGAQTFLRFVCNTPTLLRIPSSNYFDLTLQRLLEMDKQKLSFVDQTLVTLSEHFIVHTFDTALKKALR